MNLTVIMGSIGHITSWHRNIEIELENVELEALLDDIGEEVVMKHFGLVKERLETETDDR